MTLIMNEQDKLHLIELVSIFYPQPRTEPISVAISKQSNQADTVSSSSTHSTLPNSPRLSTETELGPYYKKIESWFNKNNIIIHVSTEAKNVSTPSLRPDFLPCNSLESLGNNKISLFERARFFLHYIQNFPNRTNFFRPFPSKSPLQIENPQSSALAMAYDFLDVITTKADEYRVFLTHLLKCKYDSDPKAHLLYWPYWAHYRYPSLPSCYNLKSNEDFSTSMKGVQNNDPIFYEFWPMGTKPLSTTNKESNLSTKNSAKRSRKLVTAGDITLNPTGSELSVQDHLDGLKPKRKKKTFICPNAGCNKIYKNPNGLGYHLSGGRCEKSLK